MGFMDRPPVIKIPKDDPEHLAWLRSLTLDERARMIAEACELATAILQGREAMDLPPPGRAPWPESTWALLRKPAGHGGA